MASIINASNSGFGGIVSTGDSSGELKLQTTGTTAVTIDTSQNVSLTGTLAMSSSFLRNRIINGAMVIDQRNAGASVTPTSGAYNLDRWVCYVSQSSKFTLQQNAGSVTPPAGFTNYSGMTSSSAYSVTSSDYFTLDQLIEGFNTADLAWGTANAQTVTISFWVRSSLTGTFAGGLYNSGAARSYVFTYSISSANTWEKKTITITGDTSGTWLTTNGHGVGLRFSLGGGSTYQTTANAWAAGNYFATSGSTSVVGTNGATFYITGVQLEIGSTATPFERRLYNQELANCQRYFLKLGGDSLYTPYGTGNNYSTVGGNMMVNYPVSMRTSPTLTATGPNRVLSGSANNSVTSLALGNGGALGSYIDYQSTGLTQGHGSLLTANGSTAGNFSFSAEL